MKRDNHGNLKIPWTMFSNYPVQGTGADVMTIARISAYRRIKEAGIPCLWVSTVHDSIVVDVPSEYIQQVVDIFHCVFDDLNKNIKAAFGYTWVVPMECECKQGMNMKDMIKVKRSSFA
jgi:DNA polymerase I-like protein with 3'-5' exonuclease and polymerase domains